MKSTTIIRSLWGDRANFSFLFVAAIFLLFTTLGAREIWTQEHRWADVVATMFYRHDFLHPYLGSHRYYDKPLLSYWLIVAFTKLFGALTAWSLRLPSALAGLLAIWSTYRLGTQLKNRPLGFLAGWLLLTTFYFVFWARTSSADMLNLAGSVFAVTWYMEKRKNAGFFAYVIFFMTIALTALCKGLVGAIVPLIAVLTDIFLQASWRQHFRLPLFLAIIPALIIYLLPFWASAHFGGEAYGQDGLYMVYRENILRYFEPFDHQGPIYTYFIYLPIYLLPWAVFFIPALLSIGKRWKTLSLNSKWLTWTLLCLFLFFTASGSRRSYYVLPIVPFAILFTADWILSAAPHAKRYIYAARLVCMSFILLALTFTVLPAWYYSRFGINQFALLLKQEASDIRPWRQWNIVMLDAETKLNFYLQIPPGINYVGLQSPRDEQTEATLVKAWSILKNKPSDTIFVSRKRYEVFLRKVLPNYQVVELAPVPKQIAFLQQKKTDLPIAFIPKQ